jgi:trans-aconitate methyltransferase
MNTKISHERVISWMNTIRNHRQDPIAQYRILENFWDSQLNSKLWLVDNIKKYLKENERIFNRVYIFGGWYGVLAQIILDEFPEAEVYSIDKDPECEIIGKQLCNNDVRINFLTMNMEDFRNKDSRSLYINTSVEHLSPETFLKWYKEIPLGAYIVLQSNDFYECKEHVNCSPSLNFFTENLPTSRFLMTGQLDCGNYKRFMVIGAK